MSGLQDAVELHVPIVLKSGGLTLLEPAGPTGLVRRLLYLYEQFIYGGVHYVTLLTYSMQQSP